jgi:hypothetical protein
MLLQLAANIQIVNSLVVRDFVYVAVPAMAHRSDRAELRDAQEVL